MTRPDELGAWCAWCTTNGDLDPVRFPVSVDARGLARYRCDKCGEAWTSSRGPLAIQALPADVQDRLVWIGEDVPAQVAELQRRRWTEDAVRAMILARGDAISAEVRLLVRAALDAAYGDRWDKP